MEYNYLRSKLLAYAKRKLSKTGLDTGIAADLIVAAPLYKSVRGTRKSLASAGAQNVDSTATHERYEVFRFTLTGLTGRATASVRGLDAYSRVSVYVPATQVGTETVGRFIERFVEQLSTYVPIESSPAINHETQAIIPPTDPILEGTRIFISYRREDSADVAGRMYDRLLLRFDREVLFKDVDTIPLGVDFREVIGEAVSQCRVLLAIIGHEWVGAASEQGGQRLDNPADFVRIEIESALQRGVPVIPVLVRGASMPKEAQLPDSLKPLVYRNAIEVRSDPDFHTDMDRLI